MKEVKLQKFTINIASKTKHKSKETFTKISRKCFAVVKEIDNEFKAIITLTKDDNLGNEQLVLPFTDKSLDLKDKQYIFLKEKDKYNNYVCIIRDYKIKFLNPGDPNKHTTIHDNLLIAGYIVRKEGKMYFDYEDLIAYNYLSDSHICDIKINDDKPIFIK